MLDNFHPPLLRDSTLMKHRIANVSFPGKLRRSSITIIRVTGAEANSSHQFHIHRIAHPHLQNRERAKQAQIAEHVPQIRARDAGNDEPQRRNA